MSKSQSQADGCILISKTNSKLWQNYDMFGRERGRLVVSLLAEQVNVAGAAILDFGCGEGAVALELADAGAKIAAFDTDKIKLARLRRAAHESGASLEIVENAPTEKERFDAVVLLDVIEHLLRPKETLNFLHGILKPGGVIYMSTPNRLSPVNVMCDPHFSLPVVSLLSRKQVRFLTANLLRWQPKGRIDFPQLFTMRRLLSLLEAAGFAPTFVNKAAAHFAFEHPQAIWNRDWHLKIVALAKRAGWTKRIERYLSDSFDWTNMWLNPTWYIVAPKKARR